MIAMFDVGDGARGVLLLEGKYRHVANIINQERSLAVLAGQTGEHCDSLADYAGRTQPRVISLIRTYP